MADISSEISNFQSAIYGEEVRGSMISLANKLNTEITTASTNATKATTAANNATTAANTATTAANNATTAANNAATAATEASTKATTYVDETVAKYEESATQLMNETKEAANTTLQDAKNYVDTEIVKHDATVQQAVTDAQQAVTDANTAATEAKSWAVGGTDTRGEDENITCAWYYSTKAMNDADRAEAAVVEASKYTQIITPDFYLDTDTGILYMKITSLAIAVQPEDAAVLAGEDVSFYVKGTGEGMTYQWYQSTDGGIGWVAITTEGSGYDTNTLTLTAVTLDMNGYMYKCQITDSKEQVISTMEVTLTVEEDAASEETSGDETVTEDTTTDISTEETTEDTTTDTSAEETTDTTTEDTTTEG